MAVQIQLRHDTAANWTSANPTLALGEAGFETNTGKLKFGDGSTAWTSLAYFSPSGGTPGDMLAANNLSDLANKKTARANLGVEIRHAVADANYVASAADRLVAYTSITAPRTTVLPAANTVNAGSVFIVIDESGQASAVNTITIAASGADTIDGASSVVLSAAYAMRSLFSDGTSKWTFDAGGLRAANNLSDLQSASTARTNLGLGTAATQASGAFDAAGAATAAQAAAVQRANHTGSQLASTISDFSTAAKTAAVDNTAYNATSWNSVTDQAPAKDAVRDQIEVMLTSIAAKLVIASNLSDVASAQVARANINKGRTGLTDGTNIATDASLGNAFSVTLGGNRTLDNPTNLQDGATYLWKITQDGTGSRTLAYGNKFKWPGGTVPTLTTAAASVDMITAFYDGTNLLAVFAGDIK